MKDKKPKNKKGKVVLGIILLMLILIAIIVAVAAYAITNTLNSMVKDDLDETDLAINENIYDEITEYGITKSEFDSIVNIAFFGSDSRDLSNQEEGRTDTIMIMSLNPVKETVKMISIPRDTYVNIPGHGMDKINHSYWFGQEQLAIKTINSNFGLDISEYVTINFEGLIHVINAIGGVTVDITSGERDIINNHVRESYAITGKSYKALYDYGKVELSGEQALAHARNRSIGNDFERAARQREIIEAVMEKLSTRTMPELLDLVEIFLKEVKTNINVMDYVGLGTKVLANRGTYLDNITSAQVPSADDAKGQYINKIYYFVPNIKDAKEDMLNYIYNM